MWLKCFSYWSPTYLPDGQGRRGFNNLGYSRTSVHASIDSSTWFGLFCGFLSVLIGRLYIIMDQLKISLIWHQVCIKTTSGQLSRGLSLLSRGLSCAVGLRNYAVFPSSFPCLWEAREGLGGAVRYSATSFVFLVAIDTWRHPTPYGSALKWRDSILYACHVCGVAHYLWQGEKICLSPYLYHLMWWCCLFLFIHPICLSSQGFGLMVSKLWKHHLFRFNWISAINWISAMTGASQFVFGNDAFVSIGFRRWHFRPSWISAMSLSL